MILTFVTLIMILKSFNTENNLLTHIRSATNNCTSSLYYTSEYCFKYLVAYVKCTTNPFTRIGDSDPDVEIQVHWAENY